MDYHEFAQHVLKQPRIYYPGFFKESAIRSLQSSWDSREGVGDLSWLKVLPLLDFFPACEGDVFLVSNFPVRGWGTVLLSDAVDRHQMSPMPPGLQRVLTCMVEGTRKELAKSELKETLL